MRIVSPAPSLVDQVVEAITDEIVSGVLAPGSRLIQDDLAQAYGVSRQPVQQALVLLRGCGLVQSAPGRGLIVAPLDPGFVRDLYEMRAVIEGLAARLAAERASDRAAREGPAYIAAGREAARSGLVGRKIETDIAFHRFLSELSGNVLIDETMAPHWPYLKRVMSDVLQKEEGMSLTVWDEHAEILAAVIEGRSTEAERLSRDHIARAAGVFIHHIEAQQGDRPKQRRTLSGRKMSL
ncbi:transcriptional regulator [Bradyrhizobium sp. SSBR45G]|uniref:GntR family transcriptional regulator n=1 Tax=unclassified Bradyrhizobium TaxID=2631580 RepID=UPI0023428CDF|nr:MULTISPECIES: GntR family transcriptional regulator [unclassified Bradyrhizobium]GLH82218.1 transcriptional regulator [Bradyrhizobium sp. SSBR45G]GLH89651.1 transcriptional regulator [Bradyrhizobium sp. SSBR45R]